jgi:hypothetical protein
MEELSNEQLIAVFGKGFEDLKSANLQQYKSIEKIENILNKRFNIDDDRYKMQKADEIRREKKNNEPKQIEFSRKAQKQLQTLDQSEKYSAILKEIKNSQKKESGSLLKLLSPILLLLGGVAGLAFGVEKIPVVKKLFEQFKQGSVISSLKNLTSIFNKKGLEFKEFIRNIPFVGRIIDAFDGFRLIARGEVGKGLKHLAFAIPGAEFIAQFFGTSKQRLLQDYETIGDKSKKFNFFGMNFTIEQLFQNLTSGLEGAFISITDFFEKIGKIFVQLYQVVTKGSGINFEDIIGLLNQIETYFPSVSKITGFLKMFTQQAFVWQAGRETGGKTVEDLNVGDIFNSVFTEISKKINTVIETIVDIGNAVGLIFSNDVTDARKGFAILDKYAPGLSNGLRVARNVLDKIYEIDSAKGFFAKIKAVGKAFTEGNKYSPEAALDQAKEQDIEDVNSFVSARKNTELQELRINKEIENEKNPNKQVLTETLKAGVGGAALGGSVGLASSLVPGTPFFGQPLTAAMLYGIVSGVLSSAGTFILKGASETYKDLFSGEDRDERIKKLESSKQLQIKTRDTLREEGYRQIDEDYFNKIKPIDLKPEEASKPSDQVKTQQKIIDLLNEVKELFAKQLKFNESSYKNDQELNRAILALNKTAVENKAPVIVSNNSRNFVLTDKTVSNFEYRANLVGA